MDISNMSIGKEYQIDVQEKQQFLNMIKDNGFWNFKDKTRVLSYSHGIFDVYKNKVIKIK